MVTRKTISQVQKRDGRIVPFRPVKIEKAIEKAIKVTGNQHAKASELADLVVGEAEERFRTTFPTVEDIQDIVEEVLIRKGYGKVAKAYILYRNKRAEARENKALLGVKDDLKLSLNSLKVLQRRYLLRNESGETIETPSQLFHRVAKSVAQADIDFLSKSEAEITEEKFYNMLANLEFLPNTPCLMNAGTKLGQLSACFVIPVPDSLEGIFEAVKHMTLIQQSGGGTGFDFSNLRPKGDVVRSTHGVASGPVSFMRVFDEATDVVKQGGKRRGANMGILRIDHPDIVEFITAKEKENFLTNFNISVAVTDEFMEKVKRGEDYELKNPRNSQLAGKLPANWVFDLITNSAWRTGDPGLVFIDEINRANPTPKIGRIESTNPCGEQPLLAYESCNLGSINLNKIVRDGKIDWERLKKTVRKAVHFLDNVVDVSEFPLPEIARMTRGNRKIGLGVMGWADLLLELGISYNSEEALSVAEKIMGFVEIEARRKSQELGEARGSFPNFKGSIWEKKGYKSMRNATVTTIAPTGTISIISGCSSGIEPIFAISFVRQVMEGTQLLEINPIFEKMARKESFYTKELMLRIAKSGSIQQIKEIPFDIRKIFVTALDIEPAWHFNMQSIFQKHVENAVSKTVNLPRDSSPEDVKKIYWLAYNLHCKGITVYRYGSKREQVLYLTPPEQKILGEEAVRAESEFSGGCPGIECTY